MQLSKQCFNKLVSVLQTLPPSVVYNFVLLGGLNVIYLDTSSIALCELDDMLSTGGGC